MAAKQLFGTVLDVMESRVMVARLSVRWSAALSR